MPNTNTPPKALIVTALRLEYQAVRKYLSGIREEEGFAGTIYERGTFSTDKRTWEVCLVEVGKGNPAAAFETERAIRYFGPEVVLFVGVAGGLADKGVNIGDVVCATRAYAYESGKAGSKFLVRPIGWPTTYDLEARARFEARNDDWLQLLSKVGYPVPDVTPEVRVASVAAGEKVISSTETELYQFLRENYEDVVAVEMESVGFLQAIHANSSIKAMVVRGISDLIDQKSRSTDKTNQPKAAQYASAFAFQILAKFNPSGQGSVPTSDQGKNIPSSVPTNGFEVFFSYVEKDQRYVDELQKHLYLLKKHNVITGWYGSKLEAGGDTTESMRYLDQASLILLLVSSDYITSEHSDVEVKRAMERRAKEGIRVIPIRVRPVDWERTPFSELQPIPRGEKAISGYADLDQVFSRVAKEIDDVIRKVKGE